MKRGDYYEVVLRQTFRAPFSESPSELFQRFQEASPSPYEFFLQFGDEQLIGCSPEMFVRVEGNRVEIVAHLRHGPQDRRSAPRRRQHPRAARLAQGRIRADHVYGRGSQRQVARLRPGLRQGGRAAPDRVLRRCLPHGGSCRGHAGAGLRLARRVPDAHVVRHHDRSAEEGGRAGHREPGEGCARMVRRLRRHALAQRRPEHRDSHPDGSLEGWRCRVPRRRDHPVRLRPGHGRAGNPDESDRLLQDHPRRPAASQGQTGTRQEAGAGGQDAAGGQRRLLHPHAFQLRAADRHGRFHLPRRFPARDHRRGETGFDPDLAGTRPAGRLWRPATGAARGRSGHSPVRRLPGPPGHRGGLRRRIGSAGLSHARQTLDRRSCEG